MYVFNVLRLRILEDNFLLSPECIQWERIKNVMFSLLSDNILMSEEKQRILLLERVNRHTVFTTI